MILRARRLELAKEGIMRTLAAAIGLGLVAVLLLPSSAVSRAAEGQRVILTLRITDTASGLTLEAKKPVARGSNAFEALRDIVAVKSRTFPTLGAFITSLCGVDAPAGKVWTYSVDGKWSNVGIGSLKLERDIAIEWTLR